MTKLYSSILAYNSPHEISQTRYFGVVTFPAEVQRKITHSGWEMAFFNYIALYRFSYNKRICRCLWITITGEEVSIDKQVACEECPRWLKRTEVAWEETSCRYIFCILLIEIGIFHGYYAVLKSTNIIYSLWNTLGRDSYPMHSKEPCFMHAISNFTVIFNDQPIITDRSLKYSN